MSQYVDQLVHFLIFSSIDCFRTNLKFVDNVSQHRSVTLHDISDRTCYMLWWHCLRLLQQKLLKTVFQIMKLLMWFVGLMSRVEAAGEQLKSV